MTSNKVLRALLLGFAMCLSACGGGGGGSNGSDTPTPPSSVAPAAPTNLVATPGNQSITLQWDEVSGATSYNVYQGSSAGTESGVAIFSGAENAATINALANGTTYYFIVRAVNSVGVGSASNEAIATPAATTALAIDSLELAQTHVLPEEGLSWTLSNTSAALHLVGARSALALAELSANDAQNPRLEGVLNDSSLGTVALQAPSQLPPTEAAGPAYASDLYSAALPKTWLQPGLQLRVIADNYLASTTHSPAIGADFAFSVRILPFYLFGATEANTALPLSQTGAPPAAAHDEMFAKWPIASLTTVNHAAGKVSWPVIVVGPRNDSGGTARAAYVVHNANEQKDGFAVMSAVLNLIGGLRSANGEAPLATQYYAPLIMLNSSGAYTSPGGGLGSVGGDTGTGDYLYAGVYIHEQGHAFGLPHQGEAYDAGKYPYLWGSLNGSRWGYDVNHNEFLAPFIPSTASTYSSCASQTFAGHARAVDSLGRCIKQDPMQSGSGDQASGYRYATFSDFSTGQMQRHLEGTTTDNGDGTHSYSGGRLVRDTGFASGYKRWDTLDAKWVNAGTATTQGGIFGLDQNLPLQRDVAVAAIAITLSNAGTAGATQIYPPILYTGNLLRTIDPSDANDRASIVPDTGTYYWYCRNGGCDYTLRVTYADAQQRDVLLQGGFRPFNQARGTPPASAGDPLDDSSFRTWVVNVPADKALGKLELLATPMVWEGLPASPAVLASYTP